MQGQSTGKRLALLVIIIVGLLGALLLLGWIAFWLIAFAALALFFLLLIAPFVFLLPAFGEAGRRVHHVGQAPSGRSDREAPLRDRPRHRHLRRGGHSRDGEPRRARLAGCVGRRSHLLVERVLEAARTREPAHARRRSRRGGQPRPRRDGLAGLYYRTRLAQEATRTRPSSGRAPRSSAGRAGEHDRGGIAHEPWLASGSQHHAERSLDLEYDRARERLRDRRHLQNDLKGVDSALRSADEVRALNQAAATGQRPGTPVDIRALPFHAETEGHLRSRRAELQEQLDAPEMRRAEQLVRHADANQAEHGRRWTTEDHDCWIARRRAELAGGHPALATQPPRASSAAVCWQRASTLLNSSQRPRRKRATCSSGPLRRSASSEICCGPSPPTGTWSGHGTSISEPFVAMCTMPSGGKPGRESGVQSIARLGDVGRASTSTESGDERVRSNPFASCRNSAPIPCRLRCAPCGCRAPAVRSRTSASRSPRMPCAVGRSLRRSGAAWSRRRAGGYAPRAGPLVA